MDDSFTSYEYSNGRVTQIFVDGVLENEFFWNPTGTAATVVHRTGGTKSYEWSSDGDLVLEQRMSADVVYWERALIWEEGRLREAFALDGVPFADIEYDAAGNRVRAAWDRGPQDEIDTVVDSTNDSLGNMLHRAVAELIGGEAQPPVIISDLTWSGDRLNSKRTEDVLAFDWYELQYDYICE